MNTSLRAAAYGRALVRRAGRTVTSYATSVAILAVVFGPRRLLVARYTRVRSRGGSIAVDRLPGARRLDPGEMRRHGRPVPPRPRPPRHPFKLRTMRAARYPAPDIHLHYDEAPLSGLTLAGVGETEPRRVAKFFHAGHGHIYGALNRAFHLIADERAIKVVERVRRDNRRAVGPVAIHQRPVPDPAALAGQLKSLAREHGATAVGCTIVTAESVYAGIDDYLPHAVVVAAPMAREAMLSTPSQASGVAIVEGYFDVGRAAIEVAERIRSLGWNAEADTNLVGAASKVMHVPLAVAAGLGQMGKHTSLITPEHGANVRLAVVLTDIPLAFDDPVDIGVDNFCATCQVCTSNCPPNAIFDTKLMVRGVEKWHLDFDRCTPYFVENDTCGICISVCPWSESDKAPLLTQLQQQRKTVASRYPNLLAPQEHQLQLAPPQPPDQVEALGQVEPLGRVGQPVPLVDSPLPDVEDRWLQLGMTRRTLHPGGVVELELRAGTGGGLPAWAPGAHVEVKLPSGRVRAYSLAGVPDEPDRWVLGVKIDPSGTGGSLEVATLRVGDQVTVSRPGNNYLLREDHDRYVLCAGGIGVTPMVAIAQRLHQLGAPFEVHYSVKAGNHPVFADRLHEFAGANLFVHSDRDWVAGAFADLTARSAVYACGPLGYMTAVRAAAADHGLPTARVYTEDFGSDRQDTAFDLVLGSSGERLRVDPGQTIAGVLAERGVYIPVSCGYGICGTCTLGVLDGTVEHRDDVLTEDQRKTGLTACCSRAGSSELVIDL